MKASEARKLRIDDRVVLRLASGDTRVGVVSKIEWPVFTVALLDGKARRYHRQRRYKSIYPVTKEDRVPTEFLKPHELPFWLQFTANADFDIAADFCDDYGLEQAATVLRDVRCNQNQLARIDSIVVNRDTPHLEQLTCAVTLLEDFKPAKDKLQKYVERLTELKNIGTGFRVRYDGAPVLNTKSLYTSIVS